jgi:hypothetical protein
VGDPDIPQGLIQRDLNNWQPRFGFAYAPSRLRKTVFRGGFGVFHELINGDIIENVGQPFQFNQRFFAIEQLSDPLRGLGALPLERNVTNPVFRAPFTLRYPSADTRNAYVVHYNFLVQREFAGNLSVELGYVGKAGRKLSLSNEFNPAIFGPGATLANIEQRRPFRTGLYSSLNETASAANSNYNALTLQVIRRLARGFSLQGAYTWAKSIDDVSLLTIGGPAPNPFDRRSQRGPSNFDTAHTANVSWIFDVPNIGASPLHRVALHNWEVSGIFQASTGVPLFIMSGRDVALSGVLQQTPDVAGVARRDHADKGDAIAQWFNRAAFAVPANGTYGNSARNNVRGPGQWNLNLGVFRNIPIGERLRLQFRSEFFNLTNHGNLGSPNSVQNNANFGRILSGGAARVIQFALKLNY